MEAMIITNNSLTVARMAVIAKRTSSELMAGAKSMMIENLKKQMRNGVAHFVFKKKDGTLREAWGTTNKTLAEKHINGNGCSREVFATTAFFDCEKGQWRSFRWENLVAVY
ncbi:MAG: SH3 beta-barrel fold-containing protein [Bacteroidales bacterium]|nr:SH3 beta-barrel fold-containing protein [Bacteroidales bacterium]